MTIRLLPPDVAAKIAAGEVVERPANVAKELLENSLDAGATEIRVEIREGGQRLLRVIDNGHGIPADEAALVFQRHATSKLVTADDLNQIATFGFRGEALYSIAAVSQVVLTTRHIEEEFGTQLRVEAGEIVAETRAGSPVGVVVSVEHLFFNMPARKKFLRRPATEAGHISSVVQRYALAYPRRRFSFVNDGKLLFQSTGSGDLFDVMAKVYRLENAKQMVEFGHRSDKPDKHSSGADKDAESQPAGLDAEIDFMGDIDVRHSPPGDASSEDESPIGVYGYASLPTLTRANRSNIDLFVNQRYVEDRSLTYAVIQAYHTLLPGGRFPIAAVFVTLDPALVDVNVHPQKTQVRFVDERRVFSAVQKAVRRAVIDRAVIPDMRLSDGTTVSPGDDVTADGELESGWVTRRAQILNAGRQESLDMVVPPGSSKPLRGPLQIDGAPPPAGDAGPANEGSQAATQSPSSSGAALSPQPSEIPPLRVVGQIGAMYIVAEGPEGIFLIDQHAAHERILYEKFMAQGSDDEGNGIARQHLLEPLTLHIGSEIAGIVARHLDQLNRLGYEVEPFGGDTFLVRSVPAVLASQDPLSSLSEIATALADRRNLVDEEIEARLVLMVCKRATIKAGQLLSDIEMQELVRQLEACQSPRTCPHGRPTMLQLSAGELEKAFGRV